MTQQKPPYKVFVYGTLMYPRLRNGFTEQDREVKKANLPGFFPHALEGAGFPGLKPKDDAVCEGLLMFDVSEKDLQRFDSYEAEGSLYTRREVTVNEQESNEQHRAFVYQFNHEVTENKWEPDYDRM